MFTKSNVIVFCLYTIWIQLLSTTELSENMVVKNDNQLPNILFLMCDSMDGRNMDPTSNQYPIMNMPTLRGIASEGVNFIRTYTNSPQCVPGRAAMMTSRRTDLTGAYSNNLGFAKSSNGSLDSHCIKDYSKETCEYFGNTIQNNNYTMLDAMLSIGYNVYLYGKVDIGGGIIELSSQSNSTADGWHNAPTLGIFTRSANIGKPTKSSPISKSTLNQNDKHVHAEDHKMETKCIERLSTLYNEKEKESGSNLKPWMLYCSINIPHPPYDTNETWLSGVNINNITIPIWINESLMHPYDTYMTKSKDVYGNFNNTNILDVRQTYYAMNVETDYIFKGVWDTAKLYGFNTSNTIIIFTSDHGEMNMEHRQSWKNSMYEGSSRIPLIIAGPNIKKNILINNLTQIMDILPTLIELSTGNKNNIPSFLNGNSLAQYLYDDYKNEDEDENVDSSSRDYVISQYHSNMGNTGSYMIRKNEWKYIQFGHYLNAFKNYSAQLFDVENDPSELNDLSNKNTDIVEELENILKSEINYEYVDCIAKQNDFKVFEEYFWSKYNQTQLYKKFQSAYNGFDQNDWETVVAWRNELLNDAESCDQLL